LYSFGILYQIIHSCLALIALLINPRFDVTMHSHRTVG